MGLMSPTRLGKSSSTFGAVPLCAEALEERVIPAPILMGTISESSGNCPSSLVSTTPEVICCAMEKTLGK